MPTLLKSLFHGVLIGGVCMVPGLSGGAVSVSLGEFDRLLLCINGLAADRLNRRIHLLGLIPLLLGAAVGLMLFCRLTVFLLLVCPLPAMGALCGIIIGGLWQFIKNAGFKQGIKPGNVCALVLGAGLALAIQLTKTPVGVQEVPYRFFDGLALFAGAALSTACMVIPGFSGAQMLLLLGQYPSAVAALATLDLLRLIPMGLGAATGLLFIAKLLGGLIKSRCRTVYCAILGMVCGWLTGVGLTIPHIMSRFNTGTLLLSGTVLLLCGLATLLIQRPKKPAAPNAILEESMFEKVL